MALIDSRIDSAIPLMPTLGIRNQRTNKTQKQNENQKQKDKTIVDDETQKQTHRGRCFLVTPNLVQVFILKRTTCDAAL